MPDGDEGEGVSAEMAYKLLCVAPYIVVAIGLLAVAINILVNELLWQDE